MRSTGSLPQLAEDGDRAFVLFCENEQCFALGNGQVWAEQLVELTAVTHEQA